MATGSIQLANEVCSVRAAELIRQGIKDVIDGTYKTAHVYVVDKEDRRFKVCGFCGHVLYRTDKEVIDG